MRWKLLLTASLLATIAGAGSTVCLVYGLLPPLKGLAPPTFFALGALLIPVGTIVIASIFVYRHTAKRRRLQAMMTALLAGILTLAIFLLSSALYTKPGSAPQPPPPPRNVG
jgi:Kef-type K+ transport system membrane component KefB